MNNVILLPPGEKMTVDQALDYVNKERETLEDVLITGYTKQGELYLRSSEMSHEWSLWLTLEMVDYIRGVGRHPRDKK